MADQQDRDTLADATDSGAAPTRYPWNRGGVQAVLQSAQGVLEAASATAREKRSITLEAEVAAAVDAHVERGAAPSFSAAINQAAARWAANQDLRAVLDELYAEDPDARPTEEALQHAAAKLGLA